MCKFFSILTLLALVLFNCDSQSTNSAYEQSKTGTNFSLDAKLLVTVNSISNKLSDDPVVRIVEKDLNELAAKNPLFGGIYIEPDKNGIRENDRLVLFLKEDNPSLSKRAEILSFVNSRFRDKSENRFSNDQVEYLKGSFTFEELKVVRDIVNEFIFDLNGVMLLDLNEKKIE